MIRYREKKYYCGNYLEVDIFPAYEQIKGKRKKLKNTTEIQKKLNDHNRKKKLTRLLNTNFTEKDIKIELTYGADHLPQSDEEAEKQLTNFLRRLKRYRKKRGLSDLKYIVITEKGKRSGRYHHHCVLSGGMTPDEIRDIWGLGIIRLTPLDPGTQGLGALAEYLMKNLTNGAIEENKKAWHASKNLAQPKERQNDNRISRKQAMEIYENQECNSAYEKLYPDYNFSEIKAAYNQVNGQYYLCIQLYKKHDDKIRRSKKHESQNGSIKERHRPG